MVSIHTKIFLRQRLMYFSCKLNSSASQCKAGNQIPRVHHKHFVCVCVCVSYLSIMTNRCILCMALSWKCHKIHRQGSISEVSVSYLKEQVYIYLEIHKGKIRSLRRLDKRSGKDYLWKEKNNSSRPTGSNFATIINLFLMPFQLV